MIKKGICQYNAGKKQKLNTSVLINAKDSQVVFLG